MTASRDMQEHTEAEGRLPTEAGPPQGAAEPSGDVEAPATRDESPLPDMEETAVPSSQEEIPTDEEASSAAETVPPADLEEGPASEEPPQPPPSPPPTSTIPPEWRSTTLLGLLAALLVLLIFVAFLALFLSVRNTNNRLARTNAELSTRIDALNSRVITAEKRLDAVEQQGTELATRITQAEQGLQDLQSRVDTLAQDVSDLHDQLTTSSQDWEAKAQALDKRITALQKQVEEQNTSLQQRMDEQNNALKEELTARLDKTQTSMQAQLQTMQLELLLMRSARQAMKARIHLREKSPGLAKRDLRMLTELLDEAAPLAKDAQTKEDIQKLRQSVVEIRNILERDIFPVTTVELLMDKIDEIIDRVRLTQ